MPFLINQLSDEEIAKKVQSGDIESFGILVKRYEVKMLRYARKFLSNYAEIEDLVQEAFIKAYTNIQSFDASRKFSPWLYRIAHNEFINAIRKKGKNPLPFFNLDILLPYFESKENTHEKVEREETRQMIDECFNRIDQKYREPLILYYYEDLSYKEIADVLHIPISTIGIRLKRGKKMMKNICQKLNHGL